MGGSVIDIRFQFRTQQSNGLLLFAIGGAGSYLMLQMVDTSLQWKISIFGKVTYVTFNQPSVALCDGSWHSVVLTSLGLNMTIAIDSVPVKSAGNSSSTTSSLAISSYLYIGGIPPDDQEVASFISSNGLTADLQNSK